ncbi:hypothetical protein LDO26_08155 [Luteimonas sp. BDR2-5]|uniref:hypothetical protein n=1 Tax=Proluteimonas luteida TaxID=2878685 RepID=UPI001E2FE916|nr:hypothetical protein [Luteimonas sp. BDR2-5]MCD9028181.1 hypothetical protein [Luteimonas sp. BDR2-5]
MPSQRLKTVIVVTAIAVLALGLWRCTHDSTPAASHPQAVHGAAPATDAAAAPDASAETAARQARARAEHDAALTAAVSALHRYFAVLFNADRSEADRLWVDARPAASGEADLRTLDDVRSLRTENGTPRALDTASPPDALEIPVRLRIAAGNAPIREYIGHYRLRRGHDGIWRITSASIDASPQRR